MDSQFSAASDVSTFRRGHKRRRSPKLEFPVQPPRSESHLGGAATDMQNRDGTSAEKEGAPPAKRGRRCTRKQREQFCEENQRKLRSTVSSSKDSVLSTESDRSSSINAGLEMKQERTGTGRYLFRKQNNSGSQEANSSLDLQAATPAKRNQPSRDSEIPVSPDYVRLVQQVETDENYARSLQAEFDREIEQSRSVAAEGRPVSHNYISVNQALMTSAAASTSLNSNLETATQNVRASRRIRPTLRSQSNHSSSFQYLLDAETRTEENELNATFLDSMNNEVGIIYDSLHFSLHQNIASFNYFLRDPLNIGAGLDSCGLSTAQINRLPTHNYETGDHRERFETSECQICLCAYEQGVQLRTLPCFHEFHHSCIDKWLKMNRSCPVCRSSIAVDSSDQ